MQRKSGVAHASSARTRQSSIFRLFVSLQSVFLLFLRFLLPCFFFLVVPSFCLSCFLLLRVLLRRRFSGFQPVRLFVLPFSSQRVSFCVCAPVARFGPSSFVRLSLSLFSFFSFLRFLCCFCFFANAGGFEPFFFLAASSPSQLSASRPLVAVHEPRAHTHAHAPQRATNWHWAVPDPSSFPPQSFDTIFCFHRSHKQTPAPLLPSPPRAALFCFCLRVWKARVFGRDLCGPCVSIQSSLCWANSIVSPPPASFQAVGKAPNPRQHLGTSLCSTGGMSLVMMSSTRSPAHAVAHAPRPGSPSSSTTTTTTTTMSSAPASPQQEPATLSLAHPFSHQVGGHSPCARLSNSNLVCKPASVKEQLFYERFRPEELARFMPTYHGSRRVQFPPLVAKAVQDQDNDEEEDVDNMLDDEDAQASSSSGDEDELSPWGRHCYNRLLTKQKQPQQVYDCIVLEDLTSKFNKPCVLDLKMGTRTHSDSASEKKVRRAREKACKTTTASLGLRMCGLKVFDHEAGAYDFVDKYEGRDATQHNFSTYMAKFFSACPRGHRRGFVRALLDRLERLQRTVAGISHYRFYSSSLLLVYDACPNAELLQHGRYSALVDLRMIDFANTSCYIEGADEVPYGTNPEGADEGYLFGLNNLRSLLQEELREQQ